MAITILHEDHDLVAVSKPSGQIAIPGRGQELGEPLATEVERHVGKKIFVVHRLDRGASGLMLFAKDANTHRQLSMQFEKREVKKTYLVAVQGRLDAGGHVDQALRAFGSGRMGIDPKGKPSITNFEIRERLPAATLLEVFPQTGRRHQIRVHLYSLGHPVLGDPLYGKDRPVGGAPRLMLHAKSLDFVTPSGKPLSLQADPPPDFADVLQRLRT